MQIAAMTLYLVGFIFRLIMIQKRVNVNYSMHPVGSNLRQNDAFFFILKQRMIKILQTLVFVFQRLPCLPLQPAWNVAQKVDVVWFYLRAPECSCPSKKSKTLPTSSKAFFPCTIHLDASRVRWVMKELCNQMYILFNFSTVFDPFWECVSLRSGEHG